jgi:hypothetical protein
MNDASSDAVCKCAVFAFTETSRTLLAIPLRFALTPEDRFTYPAINPLPGLDLFFIGLLHLRAALLIRKFTSRYRKPRLPGAPFTDADLVRSENFLGICMLIAVSSKLDEPPSFVLSP